MSVTVKNASTQGIKNHSSSYKKKTKGPDFMEHDVCGLIIELKHSYYV